MFMTEKLKMQTGNRRTEGCMYSLLETPLLVNTQQHVFQLLLLAHLYWVHTILFFLQPLIINWLKESSSPGSIPYPSPTHPLALYPREGVLEARIEGAVRLTLGEEQRRVLPLEAEMVTSASGAAMLSLHSHVSSHPWTSVSYLEPCDLWFWRAPQSHIGSPTRDTQLIAE